MKNYESPIANVVLFEAVDIIAWSDMPDLLITWGDKVDDVSASKLDFYS